MYRAALRMSLCCLVSFVFLGSTVASAEEFIPEATAFEGVAVSRHRFSGGCSVSDDGQWVAGIRSADLTSRWPDLLIKNLLTDEEVHVPVTIPVNKVLLSSDGRYLTYTFDINVNDGNPDTGIFQFDRLTGSTTELSPGHSHVYEVTTNADGSLVYWIQSGPLSAPVRDRERQYFVWSRETGERHDVTPTAEHGFVSTPLRGSLRSVVFSRDFTNPVVWQPLTGRAEPITPPNSSQYSIVGVNDAGDRLIYVDYGPEGDNRLIQATVDGTVLAEIDVRFGTAVWRTYHYLSHDGTRLYVKSRRLHADGQSSSTYHFVWDIPTNRIIELDIELEKFCGLSHNHRWLIGAKERGSPGDPVRIDLASPGLKQLEIDVVAGPQLRDQVRRLYEAYFLRQAEPTGEEYWVRRRAMGMSLREISNIFAQSPEFERRYGSIADEPFIALVYRNVLGRISGMNGLEFWTEQLASGVSRGEMIVAFSESAENIEATGSSTPVFDRRIAQVERLYRAHFDRESDGEGLSFWFHQMRLGSTLESMATTFSESPEFVAKYGELTDAEFVDRIYLNVLGRAGESEGRVFWIETLGRGASRGSVMIEFSESPEFVLLTDTLPLH